jgi:hypothetical protein
MEIQVDAEVVLLDIGRFVPSMHFPFSMPFEGA